MILSRFSKTALCIVALIVFSFISNAQNILKGNVFDSETREALAGAFVYVYNGNTVVKYTICGENGDFKIDFGQNVTVDKLVVNFIGYKSTSVIVKDLSDELKIMMKPQKAELKNAIVTASALEIRSDTLSYYASAFSDGSELSVGDLISKLPGLAVSTSGGITYHGVPINKFYVEGMDLMNSNYGVITNNLPADKIAKVEVYKHHQPKRVLVGISDTDKAAVNIVLKESAKNTLMVTGDAILGLPERLLFETKLLLTSFSSEKQILALIKGNNVGQNVISEIASQRYFGRSGLIVLGDGSLDSDFQSSLNPRRTVLPIPQEYWYNNLSGVSSFNHLKKISDDVQLRASLHIAGEKYTETSTSIEEISINDSESIRIEENSRMDDKKYYFLGNASYEKNAYSGYISDIILFSGQLRGNSGSLDGNGISKQQMYELPSLKIENNLDVTLRTGGKSALEITSYTKYVRNAHSATYGNVSSEGNDIEQKLDDRLLSSQNKLSTNLNIGKARFKFGADLNMDYQNYDAALVGIDGIDLPMASKSEFLKVSPGLSASGTFSFRNNSLNLSIPLHLNCFSGDFKSEFLSFRPAVVFQSTLSPRWKLNTSVQYNEYCNDLSSMLPSVVMNNYRTLSMSESWSKKREKKADFIVNYSNDPNFTYLSMSVNYRNQETDKSNTHYYTKDLTVNSYLNKMSVSENYGVRGTLTKYFGLKVFVVKLLGGYTRYNMNLWLNNALQEYNTGRYDATAILRIAPVTWFSITSETTVTYNSVSGSTLGTHRNISSTATVSLSPTKSFSIDVSSYWNKDSDSETSIANRPLLKLNMSWALKNLTLVGECRNILNNKEYHRSSIDTFRTSSYSVSMPGIQFLFGVRLSI
ncbi:MAG: carboxypeptidase-like regulatory domain-containing protein [Bacteroidales bacterium]|nr:carboxypeptidase-like regulatory domain-containing protein [Bacteroidales bacterium]